MKDLSSIGTISMILWQEETRLLQLQTSMDTVLQQTHVCDFFLCSDNSVVW